MHDFKDEILQSLNKESFFRNLVEVKSKTSNGQELLALCPFHDDKQASLSININSGLYFCHSCQSKGDIFEFYQKIKDVDFKTALKELAKQAGVSLPDFKKKKTISHDVVESYHTALLSNDEVLQNFITKRGLTKETIIQYKIGWEAKAYRYTIPIYDEAGDVVNIRRYKLGAKSNKMLSYVDEEGERYGEARIFNIDIIKKNKKISFLEGECDTMLATQYGIPAFTVTSGAGIFINAWLKYFHGKIVYIVFDRDTAGQMGAQRVAKSLLKTCEKVYIVELPATVGDKGDITNYFLDLGYKLNDYNELKDRAIPYGIESIEEEKAVDLTLSESSLAKYSGKKIAVNVMVSGKSTAPYIIPGKFTVWCNGGDFKQCKSCKLQGGEFKKTLSHKDIVTLELINVTKEAQLNAIKKLVGIGNCNKANIKVEEEINIEEIRMIPQISFSTEENEYVTRMGYHIGHGLKANRNYTIEGYVWPEPKKEFATILFGKAVSSQDNIDTFKMTPEIYESLKMFQPKGKISEKLDDIYNDFASNVIRIWGRQDLMLAVDLVFHSVLSFNFQKDRVYKGWLTLLVLGDSGSGKTTTVNKLIEHYNLGERISGENATEAGLIGALTQTQGQWMLCVNEDTLINSDKGIIPIKKFKDYNNKKFLLENKNDCAYSTDYYCLGKKKTKIITTKMGYEIEGTLEQPLLILSKEGKLEWKKTKDLKKGDYLALKRKFKSFNMKSFKIKKLEGKRNANAHDKRLNIKLPLKMSDDLAELMGLLIGNGSISYNKSNYGRYIAFCSPKKQVVNRFTELSYKLFNKKPRIYTKYENHPKYNLLFDIRINSVNIRRLLLKFGLDYWLANKKEIPISILQGKYSEMKAFIRGYFSADGYYQKPNRSPNDELVSINSASKKLIIQLQTILLSINILSSRREFFLEKTQHWYWKLTIQSEGLEKFAKEINFIGNIVPIYKRKYRRILTDNIPYLGKLIDKIIENREFIIKKYNKNERGYIYRVIRGEFNSNYKALIKFLKTTKCFKNRKEYKKLLEISNYLYLPIKKIDNSKSIVYDFYIPKGHNFIGNGFICHNSWGRIPLNDRRLLVVDEFSGLSKEIIAKFSDLISTGVASITKVMTEQTYARTRMIMMSNPREGRQLITYQHGIEAIKTLINKNEDIRRLDFALTVASGEIPVDWLNRESSEIPEVEHKYNSQACRSLVLWAWSRKPHQIIFEQDAEDEILRVTKRMAKLYTSQIPLVEPADQRFKIARLSVALASRLFSTDNGENVIVKKNHITFIEYYLSQLYSKQSMAYDQYSKIAKETTELSDDGKVKILMEFEALSNSTELISVLMDNQSFKKEDIQTQMGYDKGEVTDVIKFLSRNHLIKLFPRIGYVKTGKLITLLKEMKK